MSRVSLPIAILVPTPVAVKKAGMPAPAARMRSANVPCGTISSSILPARYSVSNTTGSEDRGKEQMILATRPSSIRRAKPTWPTPALLQATVRLVAPCSISPSMSAFGWPTAPNPPISTVAPSSMPAMASAMDWTILLIMLGASFGHAASFASNVASWADASQERSSVGLRLARHHWACNTRLQGKRREATMAEPPSSATEVALENQLIGGLQLRVAALCLLVQTCDGYDLNSVAWAVPPLIREWHLPPSSFTLACLWLSIGILAAALSAGPIGDRFGRRPLLLVSLTIFGVASLLSAMAGSLGALSLLRFFTGVGIGGGFSGAAALTGDYAPHRLRATMIMATFTGAPAGGFIGGQIVAVLLAHYQWPVIFVLGGVFPLILVLALALWLPESPRFLAR